MLEIDGKLLQGMFGGHFDLSITTMNAIVRLYHQSDDGMYARWTEKRWRHFLPVDFAVIAPVLIHWHWCLYVWDFERERVIVLDPMDMPFGEHHMAKKHKLGVKIMHAAIYKNPKK
uniref:Uncharacterized protein n=1 Tax=Setaria italica TaxID=4555 RepID=K3Y2Z0_SETIT